MKFCKRRPTNENDHQAISGRLRTITSRIGAKKFGSALRGLDEVSAINALPADRKCQIVALTGRVLLEQGKYTQASIAFANAWRIGRDTPQIWFGAALGHILSLLQNVEVEEAFAIGKKALTQAVERMERYGAQSLASRQTFIQTGTVQIAQAPIRPSVAAFRIGQQFWNEGEPTIAAWFFLKATTIEPKGACCARIALARIDLGNEHVQSAYDGLRQALFLGQFHAKTLPAWPLLITASKGLGKTGVEPALIKGLAQAMPSVRGRARLLIAKALRAYGDPAWAAFTTVQSTEDPLHIVQAELRKLEASDSPTLQSAEKLLSTPNLSPLEWLSGAKKVVARSLAQNANPVVAKTLAAGLARFGPSLRETFQHGLALACAEAKRPELAIEILQGSTADKSLWLLARLNREIGQLANAAFLFKTLSMRPAMPERFRMLASIEWMRCFVQIGDEQALVEAASELVAASVNIQDYELLLDLARQMTQAPSSLADHAERLFTRGEALALQLFTSTEQPTAALTILFKLARRQSDFGNYSTITQIWEEFGERQQDWLWSQDGLFWQYLALVVTAYRADTQDAKADALTAKYLEDPATPPNGLAELGIPYAISLIARGDPASAFDWLQWIVWRAPTYELCAHAYYWLALRAGRDGLPDQVQIHLHALDLALGSSRGMAWMQALDARKQLLSGLTVQRAAAQSRYSEEYLKLQEEEIQRDRSRL